MLKIRRYQHSDYDVVWELHYLGLRQLGFLVDEGPLDEDLEDVPNNYLDNGGEFLVGICDNRIVCMGALRRKSDTVAEIKRMRVHHDYQRRGFGQTILNRLEERASQLGYKELCLDTTTRMVPAQKLYEKNGYIETRRAKMWSLEIIFYTKKIGD